MRRLLRLRQRRGMERPRPELWRRTTIAIRRRLAKIARVRQLGRMQLSYAKVAEFQARGLVHLHAIFRLDTTDPGGELAPPVITAAELGGLIQAAAAATWFPPCSTCPPGIAWRQGGRDDRLATVAHPVRPKGWDIAWGGQIDTPAVQLPSDMRGPNVAVASYLASTPPSRPRPLAPSRSGSPRLTWLSTPARVAIRAG